MLLSIGILLGAVITVYYTILVCLFMDREFKTKKEFLKYLNIFNYVGELRDRIKSRWNELE